MMILARLGAYRGIIWITSVLLPRRRELRTACHRYEKNRLVGDVGGSVAISKDENAWLIYLLMLEGTPLRF